MRKILLVAVLALSACGKKGSEAAKGDCTASVTNAVNLSADEFKKNGVADATVTKIRESSVARCKEDKWSPEVLKCLADAKKADDVSKCQQMMTKEQSDNMSKAITGAMATQPDQGSAGSAPESNGSAGSGSAAEGSGSSAPPTTPIAGLPPECAEYQATIEKIAACDKLPAASRDMLKQSFETAAKAWVGVDKLPEAAKTSLVNSCKQGVTVLKKTAGATCGF